MDIDYSLDAIRIQKTGFFYQGERRVIYSEFKKISEQARHKIHWRKIVKDSHSYAKKLAKKQYEFYLRRIAWYKMDVVKFQSEARNAESLDRETLVGIIDGPVTLNILEAVRTGAITRKTIKDVHFQDFIKTFDKNMYLSWNFHQLTTKKRQFGSKSLGASGTGMQYDDKKNTIFMRFFIRESTGNGDDRPAIDPNNKLQRFPPDTRKPIEHLIQIQRDHDELKEQFYKDRGALEAKYEKLYQPLYDKRYNIVNGIGVTTDSESPTTNKVGKGIPEFWLFAMKGLHETCKMITEYEEEALKHLEDIKWLKTNNHKGFKLEFYFGPNPFFKNSVLTLMYHMTDEDESIIEKIIGTEIEWSCESRHLKKRRTGNRRSFFDLFSPPEVHNDYKDLIKLKYMLQGDYLIGSSVRDDIIPRAVLWFTGEARLEQYIEMIESHEDFLKNLSQDVEKRVDLLKKIQKDHNGLKAQFYKERAQLEANYQKAYANMYKERYGVVNGIVEAEKSTKQDSEVVNQEVDAEKGVPNFWRQAFVNHELLDKEISISDGEALKYLTNIKCLRKENFKGFILEFCFDKNPFFKNSVLTKTYQFLDQDETLLHKATGVEIEWYPGNCLTRESDSFFHFFNPIQIDEKAYRLIEEMKRDCYIGLTIRNEIIPRAVLWYLGEAVLGDKEVVCNASEDADDLDEVSEDEDSEDEGPDRE